MLESKVRKPALGVTRTAIRLARMHSVRKMSSIQCMKRGRVVCVTYSRVPLVAVALSPTHFILS
jgi:hypothetical protein